MPSVEFHGTDSERSDLLACLNRQCQCTYAPSGARMTCCPGHHALVEDQKFCDRLVFMRRQRFLLIGQEFHPKEKRS
jgi:hypothetical protein